MTNRPPILACLLSIAVLTVAAPQLAAQRPLVILDLPGSGTDTEAIDFDALPRLRGQHAVVNPVAYSPDFRPGEKLEMDRMRLQLHNYLVRFEGKFWCIWSDGPKVEDWPTQEVKFATSENGLQWSKARSVTGQPPAPYAFIARGLWIRDGELLALAAHYRDKGAFGVNKELELWAYRWEPQANRWEFFSKVYDNAINNFPPQKLDSGDWILTRRDARFNVSILVGGRAAVDQWEAYPLVERGAVKGFRPDEPIFWPLPGNRLNALFRDNGGSRRLYHAVSDDDGKTWTTPVLTNFPNSSSKIFSLPTSRGYRVLVSNSNPKLGRRQLHLSISRDGKRFTRMALLDVPAPPAPKGFESIWKKFSYGIASLQYPHAIEHDGYLWIALSRCKLQTEVFRVSLDAVDEVLARERPYGELIFFDDFERNESQELKDEPGNNWTTSSEKTAAGAKQVDLRNGAMYMHTAKNANHAVSVRQAFEFSDGTVGMRFRLDNVGDQLKLNFADMTLKSVHAGHLFDATVSLDKVTFEDKKTGFMDLKIRAANKAGVLSQQERSRLLKTKRKSIRHQIARGQWHVLRVHVADDQLSLELDGVLVGSFRSEGIAHPRKGLLRLLTSGHSVVDDVKIWRAR